MNAQWIPAFSEDRIVAGFAARPRLASTCRTTLQERCGDGVVLDAAGNHAVNTTFIVTVAPKSVKPPKVTAPKNIKVEATSAAGAVVTFTAMAVDPVDGVIPVVCVPASGSVFPLGQTTVTCSATNSFGKSDSDAAIVTVKDTTAPAIVSVTPSVTVLPNINQIVPVTISVVATDLVDPAPSCRITKVVGGNTDLNNDGIVDWTRRPHAQHHSRDATEQGSNVHDYGAVRGCFGEQLDGENCGRGFETVGSCFIIRQT